MDSSAVTDNRGSRFVLVVSVFTGLSTVAILLRAWSRALSDRKPRLWWDDLTAFIAWCLSTTTAGIAIAWTHHGFGQHASTVSHEDTVIGLKLLWCIFFFFHLAPAIIKISALLLFARIFENVRWFRICLWTTMALVIGWMCAYWISGMFYCSPVAAFWEDAMSGDCIDLYAWFVACGAIDVALDALILLLPMPLVFKLQCGRGRKLAIAAAFLCGYLAVIPSLGRLITTATMGRQLATDFTYEGVPDLLWCIIEAPIGVISICTPSWFQLFKYAQQRGVASLFTTKRTSGTLYGRRSAARESRDRYRASQGSGFKLLEEGWDDCYGLSALPDCGEDSIHVRKDIAVVRERIV